MTSPLQPRATRLVAALPSLTKREARLVARLISTTVHELCGDEYRSLIDFVIADEHVDELIVDFVLEGNAGPRRKASS